MISQVEVLFDYWPKKGVEWFIIGGPADAIEAQVVKSTYPNVKCLGVEPNPNFARRQLEDLGFPGEIVEKALWSSSGLSMSLLQPLGATERSASICRPEHAPDISGEMATEIAGIGSVTLDHLSDQHGPFTSVALWLDIEYAEIEALKGAHQLLEAKSIKVINLEAFVHLNLSPIVNLLCGDYGFRLRKVWNIGTRTAHDAQDYIFTLETSP